MPEGKGSAKCRRRGIYASVTGGPRPLCATTRPRMLLTDQLSVQWECCTKRCLFSSSCVRSVFFLSAPTHPVQRQWSEFTLPNLMFPVVAGRGESANHRFSSRLLISPENRSTPRKAAVKTPLLHFLTLGLMEEKASLTEATGQAF